MLLEINEKAFLYMRNDHSIISAPDEFTEEQVRRAAAAEGVTLNNDHIDVLHAIWEYYDQHDFNRINMRELHDALDEKYHHKGGLKYLYNLFPGGPIAQGCRLAGLQPPAGALDKGFGSAV